MKYVAIVERIETGFSAYLPDLPGCISTESSPGETEKNLREALEFHLEGLKRTGMEIPRPSTYATPIRVREE